MQQKTIKLAFAHCFVDEDIVEKALARINGSYGKIEYEIWNPLSLQRISEESKQPYARQAVKTLVEKALTSEDFDGIFVSRPVRKWLAREYQTNFKLFQLENEIDELYLMSQVLGSLSNFKKY